jgi:hypothetical protein
VNANKENRSSAMKRIMTTPSSTASELYVVGPFLLPLPLGED